MKARNQNRAENVQLLMLLVVFALAFTNSSLELWRLRRNLLEIGSDVR
jgi:hypothetical protein